MLEATRLLRCGSAMRTVLLFPLDVHSPRGLGAVVGCLQAQLLHEEPVMLLKIAEFHNINRNSNVRDGWLTLYSFSRILVYLMITFVVIRNY